MIDSRQSAKSRVYLLAALVISAGALTLAWNWTPMSGWWGVDRLVPWLKEVGRAYGSLAAIATFAVASASAVPLTFLTVVAILAFGPTGVIHTLVGATLGASISYGIGRSLGRDAVRQLAGERVGAVSRKLAERGMWAMIAARVVPVAPFAVVNMVAGAAHIRLRDFLIGNLLGMTPGAFIIMLFIDRVSAAARQPDHSPLAAAALIVLILAMLGGWIYRRWRSRHR